ncbi:MAG: hypothetical protein PVG53_12795, partial [Holophagae bacterium]
RVQVAADPSFAAPVVDVVVADSSHDVSSLTQDETYFWRVAAINACGEGTFSAQRSFTASAELVYLVVDDADASLQAYFTNTLDAIGVAYRSHPVGATPTGIEMLSHPVVIWTCGNLGSIDAAETTEVEAYLDAGGRFMLSAQDYLWPYRPDVPPFGQDVLGIASVDNDGGDYTLVSGVAGSPLAAVGSLTLDYPFSDWSDAITAGGPGTLALVGNNGRGAAVTTDTTVFLAFPFEAVANNGTDTTSADAQALLAAILGHLTSTLEPPMFADGFESGDTSAWPVVNP